MERGGGGEPRCLSSLCEAGKAGSSWVLALMGVRYGTPDLAQHPLCCWVGGTQMLQSVGPPSRGLNSWFWEGGGKRLARGEPGPTPASLGGVL